MKKNGFTLIELLAVIVILAIIALIAVPMVLNTIEDARQGAAKSSASTYINSVEQKYVASQFELSSDFKLEPGQTYYLEEDSIFIESEANDIYINEYIAIKGEMPLDGYISIGNSKKIEYAYLIISGYEIEYENEKFNIIKKYDGTLVEKPTIENIETTEATYSIAINVSSSDATKYYFSINEGEYIESDSGIYTFQNLQAETTYTIKVKVKNELGGTRKITKTITTLPPGWKKVLKLANIDYSQYNDFQSSLTDENVILITSNSEAFTELVEIEEFSIFLEQQNARLAMYNNYGVTESILASSTKGVDTMKNSPRYQVVNASKQLVYKDGTGVTLYAGKAFVMSISQNTHSLTNYRTKHGGYINGDTYLYIASPSTYGTDGLKYPVLKFASSVVQHPVYNDSNGGSATARSYAAIFTIEDV